MPDLRTEWLKRGKVVIPRTSPPEQLDGLRATFEVLVRRQCDRWHHERETATI